MNLRDGCTLTYVLEHEAYYSPLTPDGDTRSVTVAAADTTGGVAWEFQLVEQTLLGDQSALQLRMFDDAYPALNDVPELFAALAEYQPHTVLAAVTLLKRLGAVDMTKRQHPSGEKARSW